jgi:hypothetical protein
VLRHIWASPNTTMIRIHTRGSGGRSATNRLVSSISTLLTKGLLVGVDEPSMPWHKVSSVMDGQGLLDMGHNEVIELFW